jgi:hypothetical protein
MVAARLEVRLDPESQRKLATVIELRGTPVSTIVRELIDRAYEEVMLQRRREAVRRIAAMQIEDLPDPDELSQQLDSTYDTPLP